MRYVMYTVINAGKETRVFAALVEVKLLLVDVIIVDFALHHCPEWADTTFTSWAAVEESRSYPARRHRIACAPASRRRLDTPDQTYTLAATG